MWLPLKSKTSSILAATPQAAAEVVAEVADGEEEAGKDAGMDVEKGKDPKLRQRKNKSKTMKRNQGRFGTVGSQRMDRLSQTRARVKENVGRRRRNPMIMKTRGRPKRYRHGGKGGGRNQ